MKVYTDYSHWAQEFSIDVTLKLEDDNRFFYDELWNSYGANMGGRADGVWWEYSDKLFFRCDYVDGGAMSVLDWTVGQTRTAINQGDCLDFGYGVTVSLSEDSSGDKQPAQTVVPSSSPPTSQDEKVIEPHAAAAPPKITPPTIARLHFKDGRIMEKQLPQDSLFGLVDEMFYRLVDEQGNQTHIFQPRQNSVDSGAAIIDYDELSSGGND